MIWRNSIQVNKLGLKRKSLVKAALILAIPIVFTLLVVSCKQAEKPPTEPAAPAEIHEFTGKVKVAWGKYLYLPEAQGFDIVVEGNLESGSLADLVDKEIRVKGNLVKDEPSLFVADSIELKEGENQWRTIFTRTAEVKLTDFFDPDERNNYVALNITNINKPAEWEGKGKVKVYGQLIQGQSPADYRIVLFDSKGKELAKIIVDNITDYALYYVKKLRLYNRFWFYLNVKDTVEPKTRIKTKEIFRADVVFAGLY
ncbi:MAG: hypothetical protein N3B16_00210 [Candidatus Aminicenantes bacterium]|nr:hypothetical protein [Candidatus Aminicenantes bacterium]